MKKGLRDICLATTMTAMIFSVAPVSAPVAHAKPNWGQIAGEVIGGIINNTNHKKSGGEINPKPDSTADASTKIKNYEKFVKKDKITQDQYTMLQFAAAKDHEMVKLFLGKGIDINNVYERWYNNYERIGGEYITLLDIALINDDRELMQYLLENGADITGHPYYGKNGTWVSYFVMASSWANVPCMEYLHNWGADINVPGVHGSPMSITYYGDNALLAVIHNGQRKNQIEAVRYLIDNGINLNYQNTINGRTALMEALSDREIFYLLLNAGADTMLRSKDGKTAYDMAVEQGRLDLVKTLMDYPH